MFKYLKTLYQKHTLLRFLLTGGVNTLFGYLVFSFFTLLGLHYSVTILLVLLIGVFFNFYTYGAWVFYNNSAKLLPKFIAVYLLLYGIDTVSLHIMLAYQMNIYLAQFLLTPPLAILTYYLTKDFVFRAPSSDAGLH